MSEFLEEDITYAEVFDNCDTMTSISVGFPFFQEDHLVIIATYCGVRFYLDTNTHTIWKQEALKENSNTDIYE